MLAFGHTAVGAAAGLVTYHYLGSAYPAETLIVAGATGYLSHYLADIIPHGHFFVIRNRHFARNIILTIIFDLTLPAFFLLAAHFWRNGLSLSFWTILFAIGGAQLPDMLDNLLHLRLLPPWKLLKAENALHQATHWHGQGANGLLLSWFDLWQVTIYAIVFGIIISSSHT